MIYNWHYVFLQISFFGPDHSRVAGEQIGAAYCSSAGSSHHACEADPSSGGGRGGGGASSTNSPAEQQHSQVLLQEAVERPAAGTPDTPLSSCHLVMQIEILSDI